MGAVEVEVVLERKRSSLILVQFQLDLLQSAVYELIEHAVQVDLLDVLLRLQKQALRLLDLPLDIGHVLLESLQLLPVLLRNIQQLQKLRPVFHSHILDQILRLVLQINQFSLFLDQKFLIGLFLLEDLDEVRRWVE